MKTRLQVAMENLGGSQVRPKDAINFVSMMMNMPRTSGASAHNLHPAQVAFELFTRMELAYEPNKLPPLGSTAGQNQPELHAEEPTVALFVDNPEHLSGVSVTLRSWADQAKAHGMPFFLHMAGEQNSSIPGCKTFPSFGTLKLSSYSGLNIPMPDVKRVQEYMDGHPFDVAHLSTPGPMGLLGMSIAQRLGAPICGTYHTDFPRYVYELTGSRELEGFTWQFMTWFYGQMDLVAAPSSATKEDLVAHGLDAERIHVVGRGVKTDRFSPEKANPELLRSWNAEGKHVLLYVGRISREKNLALLAESYQQLSKRRDDCVLVVVGDGPYREEMQEKLAETPAVFTGVRKGEALAEAYASSDLFVFPSETDTFGVVLIEAQASGVPVVVTDKGGPRDCVADGRTGRIVSDMTAGKLAEVIESELAEPELLIERKRLAREHALNFTPAHSFNAFWDLHRRALRMKESAHAGNRSK